MQIHLNIAKKGQKRTPRFVKKFLTLQALVCKPE